MKNLQEAKIIDFTRIIIMGCVVLTHCDIAPMILYNHGDQPLSQGLTLAARIIEFICGNGVSTNLCHLCVPLFFFISGMLFFRGWTFSFPSYKKKVNSRVRSLLIPYLIWCGIGLILFYVKTAPFCAAFFPSYADADISFPRVLEGFWSTGLLGVQGSEFPFDFSLWFIRDLLVCVMLVPLLRYCFKLSWGWLVIAFLFFWVDYYEMDQAIFYFSFGALCSTNRFPIVSFSQPRKIWIPALSIYVVAKFIGFMWMPEVDEIIDPVVLAFGFVGLFGLSGQLLPLFRYSLVRRIFASLFFVYAFHALYATALVKAMLIAIPPTGFVTAFACFISIFVIHWTAGISIFALIQKFTPRLASLMTGGRNTSFPEAKTAVNTATNPLAKP